MKYRVIQKENGYRQYWGSDKYWASECYISENPEGSEFLFNSFEETFSVAKMIYKLKLCKLHIESSEPSGQKYYIQGKSTSNSSPSQLNTSKDYWSHSGSSDFAKQHPKSYEYELEEVFNRYQDYCNSPMHYLQDPTIVPAPNPDPQLAIKSIIRKYKT